MDDVIIATLLKNISLGIGIIGTLVGLDLISGAKVFLALKKVLDRSTDVIDKTIVSAHSKKVLGGVILGLSLIILFLSLKVKP